MEIHSKRLEQIVRGAEKKENEIINFKFPAAFSSAPRAGETLKKLRVC